MARRPDTGNMTRQEREVYDRARTLLSAGTNSWEFTEEFFGPGGRLARLWPTKADRLEGSRSPLYDWLMEEASKLRKTSARTFVEKVTKRRRQAVAGSIVVELRQRKNMSQIELSKAVGVSQAMIAGVESGSRMGTRELIENLSNVLDADPDLLEISLGRIPDIYLQTLRTHPDEVLDMLRKLSGPTRKSSAG